MIHPSVLADEFSQRWERIRKSMLQQGADAMLVTDNVNLYYVSGRVFSGYCYLPADREPLFFVRRPVGLDGDNIVYIRKPEEIGDYLREQGLDSQLLSFELTLPQIRDISKAVPAELLIYGRLPLMLMENCVMKNRTGICACQTGTARLVDRVGEEFPIVKDPGTCRNVLLNGKKLYLLDKKDALRGMGLWALRLQFTTENPGEIDKVLMDYQGRAVFDAGSYTRGLYSRGVE